MYEMLSIDVLRFFSLIIYLIMVSIIDIKQKSISIHIIVPGFIVMFIFYIFSPFNIFSLISGISVGIVVIVISIVTQQAIGLGDGLILMVIGACCGATTIYIFLYSLIILSISTVIFMLIAKRRYNIEIPMIPFYLIGMMIQVFYEKGIF